MSVKLNCELNDLLNSYCPCPNGIECIGENICGGFADFVYKLIQSVDWVNEKSKQGRHINNLLQSHSRTALVVSFFCSYNYSILTLATLILMPINCLEMSNLLNVIKSWRLFCGKLFGNQLNRFF